MRSTVGRFTDEFPAGVGALDQLVQREKRVAVCDLDQPSLDKSARIGESRTLGATVCYMESVGVRELRQNASVLLAHIAATGDSIEITNHGHPVARLVPIDPSRRTSRADLIRSGVLRPGRGIVLEIHPVEAPPGSPSTEDLLDELRDDR